MARYSVYRYNPQSTELIFIDNTEADSASQAAKNFNFPVNMGKTIKDGPGVWFNDVDGFKTVVVYNPQNKKYSLAFDMLSILAGTF